MDSGREGGNAASPSGVMCHCLKILEKSQKYKVDKYTNYKDILTDSLWVTQG
jgi:hypothetical protein